MEWSSIMILYSSDFLLYVLYSTGDDVFLVECSVLTNVFCTALVDGNQLTVLLVVCVYLFDCT